MHSDYSNIETKRINDPSQYNHLVIHVAAEAIQDQHTDLMKLAVVSTLIEGPDLLTSFLKLNATVAMSLRPNEDFTPFTVARPVEDD